VLVDGNKRCAVFDFGQNESRCEAYCFSGTPPPYGTLRWQAPEMMSGTMPRQYQAESTDICFVLEENKQPTDLFLCRVHLVGAVCISNLSIGDLWLCIGQLSKYREFFPQLLITFHANHRP